MGFSFVDAVASCEQAFTPTTSYRPQTKLRKSNVFTSVCQEFRPQRGGSVHPLGRQPPPLEQTPPPPPGRRLLQQTVRILLECIVV